METSGSPIFHRRGKSLPKFRRGKIHSLFNFMRFECWKATEHASLPKLHPYAKTYKRIQSSQVGGCLVLLIDRTDGGRSQDMKPMQPQQIEH